MDYDLENSKQIRCSHTRRFLIKEALPLDTVDNSQPNMLAQRTMHRIWTAATKDEVCFA